MELTPLLQYETSTQNEKAVRVQAYLEVCGARIAIPAATFKARKLD